MMTNKEFKKVLTESGIDFETYGYEGVLNLLCMCERFLAEEDEKAGRNALAKIERSIEHNLYYALDERGYFEY